MNRDVMLCRIELKPERVQGGGLGVPRRRYEMVCKRFPEYVTNNGWGFVGVPNDDSVVKNFLEFAADIGLEIPVDRSQMNTGITYSVFRNDQREVQLRAPLTSSALVGPILADAGFCSNGELAIIYNSRLKKVREREIGGLFAFPNIILARGEMKEKVSEAGLIGLEFRPLCLFSADPNKGGTEMEWPNGIDPLFQVSSRDELPNCKNWMFDNAGRVFHPADRDVLPDGCLPLNGRERTCALHYSRNEIAPYLNFDVVRTYEHYTRIQPEILVSSRFREVFRNLGVKGMKYDLGFYVVIDDSPWELGTDGPRHPRYSGPPPNPPVD